MCLTVPMRVRSVEGLAAHCEAKGTERTVSLMLMQHESVQPGDMLVVHLGHALHKIAPEEALAIWALYDEMLAAADGADAANAADAADAADATHRSEA